MALPRRLKTLVIACACAAALAVSAPPRRAAGQPARRTAPAAAAESARTLYVTVETGDGTIIGGLGPEAFGVFDGGTKARVVSFAREDVPTTVGLVLDASGSMGPADPRERNGLFAKMKGALLSLLVTAGKADEFFVVVFNRQPQLLLRDTSDRAAVLAAFDRLAAVTAYGNTALYDALYLALNHDASNGGQRRRVLVVVTDGRDSASRFTADEVKRAAREGDVIFYAVEYNPDNFVDTFLDAIILDELAGLSGGKVYRARTEAQLEDALKLIALELRRQYAVGIAPAPATRKDGWHGIEIRMAKGRDPRGKLHKLRARTRKGFYWPGRGN